MPVEKEIRMRVQRTIINIILSITAIVLIVTGFFMKNEKTGKLITLMGWGFVLATIIFRLFKSEFGYKPMREEIEEKMFGNTKSNIEK